MARKQLPKLRPVSFRISEPEFQRLSELAERSGSGSVSEYLRLHLGEICEEAGKVRGNDRERIREKVDWLKREVLHLSQLLEQRDAGHQEQGS